MGRERHPRGGTGGGEPGPFAELDAAGNTFRLRLIAHAKDDYDRFYTTFANPLLWFVQHELWPLAERPSIDRSTYRAWDCYRTVNRAFAEAPAEEHAALGGTPVMLHDYQLYTAAGRASPPAAGRRSATSCTSLAGADAWRVLPRPNARAGSSRGLLAYDLVGFHTER